jgi:hypothetical protein
VVSDDEPTPEQLKAYLMQVGHALNLVCELPEWIERAPLPKHLRHAAAESFAMNCRALGEFFTSTGRRSDVRAGNYCDWSKAARPDVLVHVGDKHVAHMTADRVTDPLVHQTYQERSDLREALIGTARAFAAAIHDPDASADMARNVDHAQSLISWPPPATAGEDPAAFIEAISVLPD